MPILTCVFFHSQLIDLDLTLPYRLTPYINCTCCLTREVFLNASCRVRNLWPSGRIHLDSPSQILQESMDSRHITLYDKLKYLWESIQISRNFVDENFCENGFSPNFWPYAAVLFAGTSAYSTDHPYSNLLMSFLITSLHDLLGWPAFHELASRYTLSWECNPYIHALHMSKPLKASFSDHWCELRLLCSSSYGVEP